MAIEAHTPPPPFGHPDYRSTNHIRPVKIPEDERETMTQTQLVLADPCMETARPLGPHKTAELIITKPIATGLDRGSQVAFVRTIPASGKPPFIVTAKIFDPMYYPFETEEFPDYTEYLSYNADRECSREASSLSYAMEVGLAGGFVPKYYGSWTFDLYVPGSQATRPVRLVLYEQIRGTSLYSLHHRYRKGNEKHFDAFCLPEKYRRDVFELLLDAQVRLLHKGLYQNDFAPRNVIVSSTPAADDPEPEVKLVTLIDYVNLIIYTLSRREQHPRQKLALPKNPMQHFRNRAGMQFDGWVPDVRPGYEEWLQEKCGCKDRAAKYVPMSEDSSNDELIT